MNKYIKELEYDEERRNKEEYDNYLNIFPESIKLFILQKGVFLAELGNVTWAFNKINSFELIELIKNEGMLILGLDVIKYDKIWEYTYDSLSLDSACSVEEAYIKIINYINQFNSDDIFYIFTIA